MTPAITNAKLLFVAFNTKHPLNPAIIKAILIIKPIILTTIVIVLGLNCYSTFLNAMEKKANAAMSTMTANNIQYHKV